MWGQLLGSLVGGVGGGAAAALTADQLSNQASSNFQGGSLTIGARQVGGKDNRAGATSAAQAQSPNTPAGEVPGAVAGAMVLPPWLPWAAVAAVLMFVLLLRRK